MKFGQLMKITRQELVISMRYDAWIKRNSNPTFSAEALAFATEQLTAQASPRDRRGGVSASSLGKCLRRQQFTFLGMPEPDYPAKTSAIFVNGTFMHIRWQMAGITEGFFKACEVPIPDNPWRLKGTIDAVAYNDYVVELKSAASHNFARANSFGPLFGHEEQAAAYVLTTDAPGAVFLYENKDTQEWCEIVRDRDQLPMQTIEIRAERLWEELDAKRLVEPIDQLWENKSPCSTCPFLKPCLSVKTWKEAEDLAHQTR